MGRHEHVLVRDANGRDICRFCNQVVIKPILSSDDPRLMGAGLHRSGGNFIEDLEYPPLPEMLIALYYNAKFLGLPQAPKASYIETVALAEGQRSQGVVDHDEIWVNLHRKWLECRMSNLSKQDR